MCTRVHLRISFCVLSVSMFAVAAHSFAASNQLDRETVSTSQMSTGDSFEKTQTLNNEEDLKRLGTTEFEREFLDSMVNHIGEGLIPVCLPMCERIFQDVATLNKESLPISLSMLSEVEMFYWPGGQPEDMAGVILPFGKEIGQWEIEAICSNRRFLKVCLELASLPRDEASKLVENEIGTIFPIYQDLFTETWAQVQNTRANYPVDNQQTYTVGPSLQIGNNPDHTPTLAGARLKLFSLLMIAGDLHLAETSGAYKKVLDEAIRQRTYFYGDNGLEGDRFMTLKTIWLYNRQILATAFLGMRNSPLWDEEQRWTGHELTTYDAVFTPYDLLTRHQGPLPADFTKGKQIIKFHAPLDDSEFDSILSSMR